MSKFITCSFVLLLALWTNSAFSFEPLFEAAITFGTGGTPESVFSADLDGDGDNDLAVANYGSENISILLNNGDGTFATTVNYAAGSRPISIFAADLDGDGDNDLAVANYDSDNISILLNKGDGTFATQVSYVAGDGPWSVFATDLDGDGDDDLAVANNGSHNVSILLNNGNGTFAGPVNYVVGAEPVSVFSADLDGDGDSDLAVARVGSNYNNVQILFNFGDGTFGTVVNLGLYIWRAKSVFAADFDGDGDNDLAVADDGYITQDGNIYILRNNGDGTFATPVKYASGQRWDEVFAADLDLDGDYDLVVIGLERVTILLNNGDGTFAARIDYSAGWRASSVFVTDLDGDGDNDLAVTNPHGPNVCIFKNNCDGTFAAATNYAAGDGPYSVVAADLDGDGDNDLAVAGHNVEHYFAVRLNNGDGTFGFAYEIRPGPYPHSVFSADLDGDGLNDLGLLCSGGYNEYGYVSILLNDGSDWRYVTPVNYGAFDEPASAITADLDGDGDYDLAVSNRESENVTILLNNGDGTFQVVAGYATGLNSGPISSADFDGDGDNDLAVGNRGPEPDYLYRVSILLNNGDGTFATQVNYEVDSEVRSIFSADFDGDNDYDLAVANVNVSIMLNNGGGTFAAPVNYAAGEAPWSVFATDLDGDGDDDLAVANYGSENVSILLNNGNGTFTAAVNYVAAGYPSSVFAADFDGDSHYDLAVTNKSTDNISILFYLTDPPGPCIPPVGSVVGRVTANCPTPNTGLADIGIDLYEQGTGDLVSSALTDVDGNYLMEYITPGDYIVTCIIPLNFDVIENEVPITLVGGASEEVDFPLTCDVIDPLPPDIIHTLSSAYWKGQVGTLLKGKVRDIDAATMCGYLDLIEGHFNSNVINRVVIYEPPASGVCLDKLLVAGDLLNARGDRTEVAKARQELMALLLNVASGKLSQTAIVSVDGATVSQAITFCDNIIDDPNGDYHLAEDICEEINKNREVAAGVIDLSTENIAYKLASSPESYSLNQNYPNPFNPETDISYTLPKDCDVKLTIYNVIGQKIKVLVDEHQTAGSKSVYWDGKDEKGKQVASGIYFYRMKAGEFTDAKKMILMK